MLSNFLSLEVLNNLQFVQDNGLRLVEIYNAIGVCISKQQVLFDAKTGYLHLTNVSPGMYIVNLIDRGGNIFTMKFTKE